MVHLAFPSIERIENLEIQNKLIQDNDEKHSMISKYAIKLIQIK